MKNLFKKSLLSTSILLLVSSVATASTYEANAKLSEAESKEILQELTEDMAAEGIKVTFSKTPKMRYDATLNANLKELEKAANEFEATVNQTDISAHDSNFDSNKTPLTQKEQKKILTDVLNDLAFDGLNIDFGTQPPKIEHLTVADVQAEEAENKAKYQASLQQVATSMLNSGNVANAVKVYEKHAHAFDTDVTKQALTMVQDELASMGYKASFYGTAKVTIDELAEQENNSKPLIATDKQDIIADMQAQLAETGIITDLSKSKPRIERLPQPELAGDFDEKEFTELEKNYMSELNQMAKKVLNSGSLNKAVDIIANYEQADEDIAM